MAAGSSKDETKTFPSAATPKTMKRKRTYRVAAQPETANIVDSQPDKDSSPFRFTWRIDGFSWINTIKLYSDVFEVGGYKWRVLIFPKGNNVMDHLSVYLEIANSAKLLSGWSSYAEFSLIVVNQINNEYTERKDTQHHFNEQESDWGFTSFIPLDILNDPGGGYLVNDTLVVEVTCKVDEKDTAEHLRKRLKKKHGGKKYKSKEEAESHLYSIIKVARDEDLAEQIGKDICFDLVDYDKVKSFHVQKQTSFNVFKEEVAKEFGIPAQFQRFWVVAKRHNDTRRPFRPLTPIEEAGHIGQLKVVNKVHKSELKLFFEVERGLDLRPIAPLNKGKDDILLFFKSYDPEKEELRYVGRLFVSCTDKPSEIVTKLNKWAGYDPDEEIELYEEIMFEPNVMCEAIDKKLTFQESELENGDIICFQNASEMDNKKHFRYPDVPSYLEYMRNRQVPFCPSAQETKDEESLEEQNINIIAEEMDVDKNTETQPSKVNTETTHDESSTKADTSKLVSIDLEEVDDMINEDVIAVIDKVLSEGITISLNSQHCFQDQKVSKLDAELPKQLLQELRDIAFKEDLIEKLKEGFTPNVNLVKERIDANAEMFSSWQLEQVGVVVNLLNDIVRMYDKHENLTKELDSAKKSNDKYKEALKEARQKILNSKTSFSNQQTQLDSLDAQIADLKSKLEKLQGDRAKMAEIQDQEKDKITIFNKEVKSIFHHLANDQIKLKSMEHTTSEVLTTLKSQEKFYISLRAVPPF
ncbi:hypothetical protein RYX36_005725 [Vicia faba]